MNFDEICKTLGIDFDELKYKVMLCDLLAVIHRDGGHKTEEVGIKKSWQLALLKVAKQNSK